MNKQTQFRKQKIRRFVVTEKSWNHLMNSLFFSFSEDIVIWSEISSDRIFWKKKDFLSFDSFDMEST